jgi:diaminopimelate decarboxylase
VLSTLPTSFSTPAYLFDRAALRRRCETLSGLVGSYPGFRAAFMAKANWAPPVLQEVARAGLEIVVTSDLELTLALRAGFPPARIIVAGPVKGPALIQRSLAVRVGLIFVESAEEALAIGEQAPDAVEIGIRVALTVQAHQSESLLRGRGDPGKFGVPTAELVATARTIAAHPRLRLAALSANTGSQIVRPAPLRRTVAELVHLAVSLRSAGHPLTLVDAGGGLPSELLSRRFSRPGGLIARALLGHDPFPVFETVEPAMAPDRLVPDLLQTAARQGLDLLLEPGRWVVADCMQLATRVLRVNRRGPRTWVFVDAGIDALPDAGFGERRPIRRIPDGPADAPAGVFAVAGPLCLKGDVFARSVQLPADVAPGDLLLVAAAGAYGFSRASWFGGGLPAIVEILPDRSLRTLWSPPSVADLMEQGETARCRDRSAS